MARPINPTPVLYGEDKKIFLQDLDSNRFNAKKERFLTDCDHVFEKVKKDLG